MAPNRELIDLTQSVTGRPAFLMRRGVDTQLFTPARRHRTGGVFRIGYVGRLSPEKNVRFLAELGAAIAAAGHSNFEFVIVGEGSEERWLRRHLSNAAFTGVLRGEPSPGHTQIWISSLPVMWNKKRGELLKEHQVLGLLWFAIALVEATSPRRAWSIQPATTFWGVGLSLNTSSRSKSSGNVGIA